MSDSAKNTSTLKSICISGLMAALVMVAIYIIHVPIPAGNGYVHLGDTMIFLSIVLIGTKRSVPSAGIGAALADILAGWANYALPSFIIKALMVLICGALFEKCFKGKPLGFAIGGVVAAVAQSLGYALVNIILYGEFAGIAATIPDLIQGLVGIVIAFVIYVVLGKTGVLKRLQSMAK